jgi:Flp pilus assembly protein TadD
MALVPAIAAQASSPVKFYGQVEKNFGQASPRPTTVHVCGTEAFDINADAGGFTKVERTLIVERNINNALIASTDRTPAAVEIVSVNHIPVIRIGGKHVVTVDSRSAQIAGMSMGALADEWANSMRRLLADQTRVTAYVDALAGDFLSPTLQTPFRYSRLEAARKNHAADLFKADLPVDLISSDFFEDRGMSALLNRNLEDAANNFRKAIAMENGNARAHYGLGATLLKQGKVDDAIPELEFARHLDADDAEVHMALGQAMESKGLDKAAITRYTEASLLQPDNPEPVLYIADLREARNDIGLSVKELTQALTRMPDSQYIRLRRNDQLTWRLKRAY